MRDGICRKCGAAAVHTEPPSRTIAMSYRMGCVSAVVQYVCTQCGYLEEYVEPAGLAAIADHWPAVPVTAPPAARSDAPTRHLPGTPDV